MGKLDPGAYSAILRTRQAYRFDVGALLMRLFAYTTTIGTISMLTLAGASAFEASSVASLIAVCMFFVAPRVSKRIDERGQSAVVPGATAIAAIGLAIMFATTHLHGPFWVNYLAAPLVSFLPNAQALVRTRWTYLIASGRLGNNAPPLKTAYAYEGMLEDIAFMVGPAAVIALSATIAPIAGMLIGCIAYCLGAVLLISAKDTEPQPGWKGGSSHSASEGKAEVEARVEAEIEVGNKGEAWIEAQAGGEAEAKAGAEVDQGGGMGSSVLRTSAVVRVLFVVMILFGAVYGSFDTSCISYCESIDQAPFASLVFMVESVLSVFVSFSFGMLGLAAPLRRQFIVFAVLFGCFYSMFFLVGSPLSLLAIACLASVSYAPLYITANVTCERAVSSANLTEAISWLGSGQSIGMVIGPISAGAVVDAFGPLAGFNLTALFAAAIVVVVLACVPVLRKHL